MKMRTDFMELTAFRELLARIDSDTIRHVLGLHLEIDKLTDRDIDDFVDIIMSLKHSSLEEIDNKTYRVLYSFLKRLDTLTIEEVLSRQLFGQILSEAKIQEYESAIFYFYANNYTDSKRPGSQQ